MMTSDDRPAAVGSAHRAGDLRLRTQATQCNADPAEACRLEQLPARLRGHCAIAGLGACAKADVDTFAERRASDLSHEVQRAENRVDAFAARSQYRDQAERRTGIATPSDSESHYQDQVERRMRVLR